MPPVVRMRRVRGLRTSMPPRLRILGSRMSGCREEQRHHKAIFIEELCRHTRTDLKELERSAIRRPRLGERHTDGIAEPAKKREQEIFLRRKIIVKRPDPEIRCPHDVRNRRILVAVLRELADRRLENHPARLHLLALAPSHHRLQQKSTLSSNPYMRII